MTSDASTEKSNRLIVRLTTTSWIDKCGVSIKKNLRVMKRLSEGSNLLIEDALSGGVDLLLGKVENLFQCEDGLYHFIAVNITKDWETGYVDDYDYRLVKYTPPWEA